ncbi:MAG: hypothetical protein OXK82_13425 [Deltaproteobacteria bacterium]|nr:hypothetical protein [Deltaproteobacteria bacterium]
MPGACEEEQAHDCHRRLRAWLMSVKRGTEATHFAGGEETAPPSQTVTLDPDAWIAVGGAVAERLGSLQDDG